MNSGWETRNTSTLCTDKSQHVVNLQSKEEQRDVQWARTHSVQCDNKSVMTNRYRYSCTEHTRNLGSSTTMKFGKCFTRCVCHTYDRRWVVRKLTSNAQQTTTTLERQFGFSRSQCVISSESWWAPSWRKARCSFIPFASFEESTSTDSSPILFVLSRINLIYPSESNSESYSKFFNFNFVESNNENKLLQQNKFKKSANKWKNIGQLLRNLAKVVC